MSEHTTDTVIGNKDETIRRLIEDRDFWKKFAIDRQHCVESLACQNGMLLQMLAQKGGA